MAKSGKKTGEISTKGLLKKVRKPPAPPSRIHTERKKYKRGPVRITEENGN